VVREEVERKEMAIQEGKVRKRMRKRMGEVSGNVE
jgi:hypothetical protein